MTPLLSFMLSPKPGSYSYNACVLKLFMNMGARIFGKKSAGKIAGIGQLL
jgi:hypothetical protein